MEAIKLTITGAQATVTQAPVVTSGMVGMPVEITYDEAWQGMEKHLVFRAGKVTVTQTAAENTVPWEVLKTPGQTLRIGVYGTSANGVTIPTVWATVGVICEGTVPGEPQAPAQAQQKPKLLWELRVPGTKHGFNQTQSWDDENKYFQVWDPVHGDIRWNRYWYEDVNLEPDVYLAELFQELFANLDGHIPVRVEMEINDILYTVGYPTRTTCYVDGHVMDRVMILCSDPTVDCTTYSDLTVVELSRFGLFCSFSIGVAATYHGWNVRVYGQEVQNDSD